MTAVLVIAVALAGSVGVFALQMRETRRELDAFFARLYGRRPER